MQIFVRGLDSSSTACEVDVCTSVGDLKHQLQHLCHIPAGCQVLVYSGRQLQDEQLVLSDPRVGPGSTLHLTLRLRGGKGGFGALLRGQGRDGKITTNFDACRDLQGRRMKTVNAEKKLKDWENDAKERELEKLAIAHIKEVAKAQKKESEHQVDVDAVKEAQRKTVENVQEAVKAAVEAENGKRKASTSTAPAKQQPQKKSKMLAALEEIDSDDSSDEDSH